MGSTRASRSAGHERDCSGLGVGRGDRVAAYMPNVPETIVAFLATASLGAIWTSCAPEFGVQAVLDRFGQIDPKVLLVVDGYRYGSRDIDRRVEVQAIRDGLPSLHHTVALPYLGDDDLPDDDLVERADRSPGPVEFEQVAADHPLYVLYSSGTTGMPKPIVHGHGGILLEHLEGPGPARRPRPGRPVLLVHHDRLDDVELPRQRTADRCGNRHLRWRPGCADAGCVVGTGRRDRDHLVRRQRAVLHDMPQDRPASRRAVRPVARPGGRLDRRTASGRRVPLGVRRSRPRRDAVVDQRRNRHLLGVRRRLPDGAGGGGRDLVPLPRCGGRGIRRDRPIGRRRAGRTGDHQADAVDADRVLGRRRTARDTEPPTSIRTPGVAPRRLDHARREGQLRHHRPLRRHAEPWRRSHRHQRDLPRRRSRRRCERQPDRAPRGHRRRRRRRAGAVRRARRRCDSSTI